MAIIKTAKNMYVTIRNTYICTAKTIRKTSEEVIIDATKENLLLNSNKKIITNGKQ